MQKLIVLLSTLTAVWGLRPSVSMKNGTVRWVQYHPHISSREAELFIGSGVDLPQFAQSIFLGVPYAQPPIGNLRLRPPRSMYVCFLALSHKDNCRCSNESFGTLDASAYGPHCWSAFTTGLVSAACRELTASL